MLNFVIKGWPAAVIGCLAVMAGTMTGLAVGHVIMRFL